MIFPSDPPEDFGTYDLAPPPVPVPVVPVRTGEAPEGAGMTAPALAYRAPTDEGQTPTDRIRDVYLPLWLLGGGVAVEVVAAFVSGDHSVSAALTHVGLELVLGTSIMLAGVLLAARARGISFGPLWTAMFKLAAISVAPAAALSLAAPLLGMIPFGSLIGLAGEFVLYFALIGALFDLDQEDTWYCVCVTFVIHLAVYFGILALMWRLK